MKQLIPLFLAVALLVLLLILQIVVHAQQENLIRSVQKLDKCCAALREIHLHREEINLIEKSDLLLDHSEETVPTFESEEQSTTFYYEEPYTCRDIVVIQFNTRRLAATSVVNPHRNLMVVDCTGYSNTCDKEFLTASVPFERTTFADPGQNQTFGAILIAKEHLTPGRNFRILGKELTVLPESKYISVYLSYTVWRNIQNKSTFTHKAGLFSYQTPGYEDHFRVYSHITPFTQTYLLQVAPLGSVNGFAEITDAERGLSSSFVDYDWCTNERRCNGRPFAGQHDDYGGEASRTEVVRWINLLFTNVYYHTNHPLSPDAKIYNVVERAVVNEVAEYAESAEKGGQLTVTGYHAVPPEAAYISTTVGDAFPDNELVHELGHTYLLDDWTGLNIQVEKTRSFQLNYRGDISLPYLLSGGYPKVMKKGAMNGGSRDETDYLLTSYTDHSLDRILRMYNDEASAARIDPQIKFAGIGEDDDTEAGGENYVTTIICGVRDEMDLEVVRINAYLPSIVAPVSHGGNILVIGFDRASNIVDLAQYEMTSSCNFAIALPQGFYPEDGYLHVTNKMSNTTKKYFVRDDSLQLPRPTKGFV